MEIFNKSGCNELVEKFGPWFSLDQNPRAQIFQRNQTDVTDVDSMVRLMRYGLCVADLYSQNKQSLIDVVVREKKVS